MTQEHPSGLLLTASGIQHRVPRRTVAPHPAQAFTNAPRGTRPLWSVLLARGSADDSWHGTTPCCPPCPDRLGCAKSDGGSDSPPLRSAGVDHRPDTVLLAPSGDIRSDCGLPAS